MPWSSAQYRFTLPATSDPADERGVVLAQSTDGGADIAQLMPGGRAVRLQNARDLYLLLRELFEGEVHLSAGLSRVERHARQRFAEDRQMGRFDTPEAAAAWDALAEPMRDRYLLVARRDLELQGLAGPGAADVRVADIAGAGLALQAQVEYRAIAILSQLRGLSMPGAHQAWAELGGTWRRVCLTRAREALGRELVEQKAVELYSATGDQVHTPWDRLGEVARGDYLRRATDLLVQHEVLDGEGRLVLPEEP